MEKIAIVLIAYNRVNAFRNVLLSLKRLETSDFPTDLIISLEYGSDKAIIELANQMEWKLGKKRVVIHREKLGLRNHFIWAGNQTVEYNNIIFLEDDLYVSPFLLDNVQQLIEFYKSDAKVAGISLYAPAICEFNATRFYPICDEGDAFFLQHPYWGNVWQREKWQDFIEWYKKGYVRNDKILPIYVRNWKDTSFKVVYIQYLIETGKYIVYPRVSLVDNCDIAGIHNIQNNSRTFGTVMQMSLKKYTLLSLEESDSVYDASFEISAEVLKRHNSILKEYDFQVDLKGTQDNYYKDYVLTYSDSRNSICSFREGCKPPENSILLGLTNGHIKLIPTEKIKGNKKNKIWFDDFLNNNMNGNRYLLRYICEIMKLLINRIVKRRKL